MNTRKENELVEIKKSIIKTQFVSMIAVTLIGLGVYGIFVAKGNAFHPVLNNQEILNAMLVVGIILEIRHIFQLIPLLKRYAAFKRGVGV
ncbi:MAG: hypothetical protein H6936_09645 [Burkholderiales bacterium]|nr:hypothetical protein [Nitrosomonas sp.]MCP5275094.1 hypothetical protein [Burkholderiales bacterium]